MPNGQPSQLANLRPYKPGEAPKGGRRSRDIDAALRLARKGCCDAVAYALQVLHDPAEAPRYRLKAAEILLQTGLPSNLDGALERLFGQVGEPLAPRLLTVVFIRPGDPAVDAGDPAVDARPNGNGTFSVRFEEPAPALKR
jgi:hypothetical protein